MGKKNPRTNANAANAANTLKKAKPEVVGDPRFVDIDNEIEELRLGALGLLLDSHSLRSCARAQLSHYTLAHLTHYAMIPNLSDSFSIDSVHPCPYCCSHTPPPSRRPHRPFLTPSSPFFFPLLCMHLILQAYTTSSRKAARNLSRNASLASSRATRRDSPG
jgi:hypothetical protein